MNSPVDYEQMRHEYKNPDYRVQIFLDVLPLTDYHNPDIRITHHGSRNVWMQFLLDVPNKVSYLRIIVYDTWNLYMIEWRLKSWWLKVGDNYDGEQNGQTVPNI